MNREVAFAQALPLFFKNYTVFTGRSSRGAYWWVFLISVGVGVVDRILFRHGYADGVGLLGSLWALATIIPSIALSFRRLHDTGKSAWWLLIGLIPLAGAIVLIVFFAQPGQRMTNEFGPDVEAGRPA